MRCDLCCRETMCGALCEGCAEMISRISAADQRMQTKEICEAERLENDETR